MPQQPIGSAENGNWSSFQLANSTPPLSVTGSAIAPSARMEEKRRLASVVLLSKSNVAPSDAAVTDLGCNWMAFTVAREVAGTDTNPAPDAICITRTLPKKGLPHSAEV